MQEDFISFLERKLTRNFDIYRGFKYNGETYDLFAKSHVKNIRTFLTKKDVIDCYENNEYIFIKNLKTADFVQVELFVKKLIELHKELVKPDHNHMSTYITGILLIQDSSEDIRNYIKNFRYKKVHKFYLHGWSEIRIVLFDLYSKDFIFSKSARSLKKVLEAP